MRASKAVIFIVLVLVLSGLATFLLVFGSSDGTSLAELVTASDADRNAALSRWRNQIGHYFQLLVSNWRLLLFGAIALGAALAAALFAWKAVELARRSGEPAAGSVRVDRQFRSAGSKAGLSSRLAAAFSTLLALLGILIAGTVYFRMEGAVNRQVLARAATAAGNLADAVEPRLAAKDRLGLHALIDRYAIGEEVAYISVVDRSGAVVADSAPGAVRSPAQTSEAAGAPTVIYFNGEPALETRVTVPGGGFDLRYAIRRASMDDQFRTAWYPIAALIVVVFLAGMAAAVLLAKRIARPIVALRDAADRISHGDFDRPVGIESRDEVGDLAQSLERLRSSLHAAMIRLTREP